MQRDHVFLRGSVYHCRFVYVDYPELQDKYGLKERKSSLRTKNRAEAEALAAPHIAAHKLDILGIKNLRGERHPDGSLTRRVKVAGFEYLYPLGDYIREDGVRVIAEKHKALLILDGRVVGEEPNELRIVPTFRFDPGAEADKPRRVVGKNPDDEIIETWKADRATTKHISREGDRAWVLFKEITGNKPLKHCTREDGRKLAKTLFEQGKRRATVQKYLNHLNSAVNIAIEDGKFKGTNPFSRVLPKRRKGEVSDELAREPFDDDDMRLVRDNLHAFQPDEQLLWCILATTGMRRGEAWHIQGEKVELGIRYVIVGTKSEASLRRVALPADFLALYPGKITGLLFQDSPVNVGKRLLRRIRALGITEPSKVLHSLRHRAASRLRACECPEKTQNWILGHEEITIPDGYGKGPPVSLLKRWIDEIGM